MNHMLTIDLYAFFLGMLFVVATYGLYKYSMFIQKCITGFQTEYYEIKELLKRTCESIVAIQAAVDTRRNSVTGALGTFCNYISELLQLYIQIVRPARVTTPRPPTPTQPGYSSNIDEFIRAQQNAINETQRRVDEAMAMASQPTPTQSHYESDTDSDINSNANSEISLSHCDETSEHERLQRLLEA